MDYSSSGFSSSSDQFKNSELRQIDPGLIEFSTSIDKIQERLVQFYKKYPTSGILYNKCIVPHKMLQRKEELQKQNKEEISKQIKMNDQITIVHQEINALEASIAAHSNIDGLINDLKSNESVSKNKKQLQDQIDKYAQQENDTLIEIKTEKLEQQIARKLKSEETMIKILTKKIEQEQKRTQQYTKMRMQIQRKLEAEKQLSGEVQADRKALKDQKLIEDRVKMLETDIQRLEQAIARVQHKI